MKVLHIWRYSEHEYLIVWAQSLVNLAGLAVPLRRAAEVRAKKKKKRGSESERGRVQWSTTRQRRRRGRHPSMADTLPSTRRWRRGAPRSAGSRGAGRVGVGARVDTPTPPLCRSTDVLGDAAAGEAYAHTRAVPPNPTLVTLKRSITPPTGRTRPTLSSRPYRGNWPMHLDRTGRGRGG